MTEGRRPGYEAESESLRLDRIVLEAAALEPEKRSVFLGRLTAEHPDLVERARRLLAAAEEVAESFLAEPAIGLLTDEPGLPRQEPALESVDPARRYTLGERIGRGGMAEVFRAHDHQLDRPVALKLLDDAEPASLSRGLREARTQARIQHGNVLEVYDTGELEGRPFIALRLVEGSTLDEAWEGRALEQQVALLVQAADGLDAAHRAGLVHGDVKPSNVLVEEGQGGEPRVWVSDFGLATTPVPAEGESALAGTVPYLAPERLDPRPASDHRADLWSFGVMAYQLLTGALPFDQPDLYERLRAIRRRAPPPPRQHRPELPADLEAIVLRCLAKDPADRYPTAAALAADLRRFLAGEVVEAHAASFAYRAARFALRHRGWVRFAAVAVALLVASLMAAGFFGWRAMRSEEQVVLRRQQAEELIGFMLLELRDKLDRLGRLELLDDIGSEAMRYFATVPAAQLGDRELASYATALHQIGEVRLRRGELPEAVEAFSESLNLARAAHERDPQDLARLYDLGQSHFWLGYGYREQGHWQLAEASFQAYLDLSRELVEQQPDHPPWQLELAYAHSNLGTLHEDRGELEAARQRFESSLEITHRLAEAAPEDLDLQSELAWAHNALAVVLTALGEAGAGRNHLAAELEIRRRLVAVAPDDARWRDDLAVSHNYFGLWELQYGSWPAAAEHFAAAIAILEGLAAADPTNAKRHLRLAINRIALGRTWVAMGEAERGLAQLEAARESLEEPSAEQASGLWRRQRGVVAYQIALTQWRRGDLAAARPYAEKSIEGLQELAEEVPDDRTAQRLLGDALVLLGDLESSAGNREAARASWQQAADRLQPLAVGARDRPLLAARALALVRLGASDEAAPLIAELQDSGFCDPNRLDLCAPGSVEERRREER